MAAPGIDRRSLTPAGWANYSSNGYWRLKPHLALLNRALMEVSAGRIKRLMVWMPPRHGKSELVSGNFPAWHLGLHPDDKVILTSYEATFAASWGERNRDALQQNGAEVFGIRVKGDSSAKAQWRIEGHRGAMYTAGVGGPITGKGAHIAIIDDPVKNDVDANSQVMRDKTWEWYRATFRTRLEPGGAIIVIQTRWHDDDLSGRILRDAAETGEEWTVLNLAAIAEEDETVEVAGKTWTRCKGEALWPERYDVKTLREIAAGIGSYWWNALYQQKPVPSHGGVLKPKDFRSYEWVTSGEVIGGVKVAVQAVTLFPKEGEPRTVRLGETVKFQVLDLAVSQKTSADFTVIGTFARIGPDLIVLDWRRERMEGPDIPKAAWAAFTTWHPAYVGVESVAFQTSVAQDLRRGDLANGRRPMPVREIRPAGDKVSRALTLAARMEGGNVYLPRNAPWLAELTLEVGMFPKGAHDDQVDVMAYASEQVSTGHDKIIKSW